MISRVKPGNWSVNETLTSAQANALDTNTTWALDKRGGQSDTLASTVDLTGTFNVDSAANLYVLSGGFFTVNASGNLNVFGTETIKSGGLLTVASSGTLTTQHGSNVNLNGTIALQGPMTSSGAGLIHFGNGTTSHVDSGGTLQVDAGGTIEVSGTGGSGLIQVDSSGIFLGLAGSLITLGGTNSFPSTSSTTFASSATTTFNNIPVFANGFLCSGTGAVTGALNFNGAPSCNFNGTTAIHFTSGTTTTCDGPVSFTSGSALTVSGSLNCVGATATLDSGTTVADAATTTKTGPTIRSGGLAYQTWRSSVLPDSNHTVTSPHNYDLLEVPAITANRDVTLNAPLGAAQCFLRIYSSAAHLASGSGFYINVKDGANGGAQVVTCCLSGEISGPSFFAGLFYYNGSKWIVVGN